MYKSVATIIIIVTLISILRGLLGIRLRILCIFINNLREFAIILPRELIQYKIINIPIIEKDTIQNTLINNKISEYSIPAGTGGNI